jgi:hypothetical protein
MLRISYKNKDEETRELIFNENNLAEVWYDIKTIIDSGATILWVYRTNK